MITYKLIDYVFFNTMCKDNSNIVNKCQISRMTHFFGVRYLVNSI